VVPCAPEPPEGLLPEPPEPPDGEPLVPPPELPPLEGALVLPPGGFAPDAGGGVDGGFDWETDAGDVPPPQFTSKSAKRNSTKTARDLLLYMTEALRITPGRIRKWREYSDSHEWRGFCLGAGRAVFSAATQFYCRLRYTLTSFALGFSAGWRSSKADLLMN
jgi:hypothetical protein